MRGPKPIPTAIKRAAGNPGQRPLNENEPHFKQRLPPHPDFLNADAVREWRRIGRILLDAGVLTEADRAVMAAYCQAYGRWAEAERKVAKAGPVIKLTNKEGAEYYAPNPFLQVANRALEQVHRLAAELGLSPSSRSRVQVKSIAEAVRRRRDRTADKTPGTPIEDPRKILHIVGGSK